MVPRDMTRFSNSISGLEKSGHSNVQQRSHIMRADNRILTLDIALELSKKHISPRIDAVTSWLPRSQVFRIHISLRSLSPAGKG